MNEYFIATLSIVMFLLGGGMTFFIMRSIKDDPTNVSTGDLLGSIYAREAVFVSEINNLKEFASGQVLLNRQQSTAIKQLTKIIEENGLSHSHVDIPDMHEPQYNQSPHLTFNINAGGDVDMADMAFGGSNRERTTSQKTDIKGTDKDVNINRRSGL